jgi:hypothetical protein
MMVALLVAGIGILLAGLLAVGYGIPVKEFSFGNTLIIAGAIAVCSGAIMLGLWVVVRELRVIARRLGPDHQGNPETALQPATGRTPRKQAPDDGFLFSPDQPAVDNVGPPSPPPWHDEAASHGAGDAAAAPDEAEAAPAVKPRRNLLFSSSSRKERERATARAIDPSVLSAGPATAAPPPLVPPEPPPATFDDAWPKSERARAIEAPLPGRSPRMPTTSTRAGGSPGADRHPPAAGKEDAREVTVLKSGVVDGMAYSLYSDGSIEAQMPEGMMRFASIDELRAHLDQRP